MMQQMTSRERVLAALAGKPVDRVPVMSPVSLATSECMRKTKCYFPHICLNGVRMAALAETSYTDLGFDSIAPYFSVLNEAGALGCDVDWGSGENPSFLRASALKRPEDFVPPKNYLDAKPIKSILTAISILKKRYGGQAAIMGKVVGPLSLIFYINGIQNTLNTLILAPEKIWELLSVTKELCKEFALAQLEAGADVITISEDAAGDLISRECYRISVMDTERELTNAIKPYAPVIFHLTGNVIDRADLFRETGFDALSYDSRNNLQKLKTKVGDMKLVGGVNNLMVLLNGRPKDVAKSVQNALAGGVDLIAPEMAIPVRTTNENLLAMVESTKRYGKISSQM